MDSFIKSNDRTALLEKLAQKIGVKKYITKMWVFQNRVNVMENDYKGVLFAIEVKVVKESVSAVVVFREHFRDFCTFKYSKLFDEKNIEKEISTCYNAIKKYVDEFNSEFNNICLAARINILEKKLEDISTGINNFSIIYRLFNAASSLPTAVGFERIQQKGSIVLLDEIKRICDEHGIDYWIDAGILLGAVRHSGFVPWDDDIDLGMMRFDYDRIIDIINHNSSFCKAYYGGSSNKTANKITIHAYNENNERIKGLFLEIFPYDFYKGSYSLHEKIEISNKVSKLQKAIFNADADTKKLIDFKKHQDYVKSWHATARKVYRDNIVSEYSDEVGSVMLGVEFYYPSRISRVHDYDSLFPLIEISFEGKMYKCPRDTKRWLFELYGDYQAYPKNIHRHVKVEGQNETIDEIHNLISAHGIE